MSIRSIMHTLLRPPLLSELSFFYFVAQVENCVYYIIHRMLCCCSEMWIQVVEVGGGILIIFTGDAGSINARLNMGNWYYLNCIGHVCVFTKRAMKLLLGNSGFKVRKILTHNHDGSLSVIKWIYCSVRNKISKERI